jgi:hypothetical protein
MLVPGLALPALLLSACVAEEDDAASIDDLQSELTSAPPTFTSLVSAPPGMQLGFYSHDPATTQLVIYKMDRNDGAYRRLTPVPLTRGGVYAYTDGAVVLGHEYCYMIGSFADGQSRGVNSQPLCAFHTAGSQPLPPTAPVLRLDGTYERTLHLAFQDAASDETGFTIERLSAAGWHTLASLPASTGSGLTLTHIDQDLDLEQSYCYRVRVQGANGSSLSNAVCGKTTPLLVGEPVVGDQPRKISITHPRPGSLALTFLDQPTVSEWDVFVYDGVSFTPTRTAHLVDHTTLPAGETVRRESYVLDDLEPGRLYCFDVTRNGRGYPQWLCESPSAARSDDAPLDPRPAQTPSISAITAPANSRLAIDIANPQPGQVLERIDAATGVRRDINIDPAGAARFVDINATAGQTFCYRLFVFNTWGARYSDVLCATSTATAPERPRNLHVSGRNGTTVGLDWDNAAYADSYELSYTGKRPHYTGHSGTRTTSLSGYNFVGYESYTYCFKVRAKNAFATSAWSTELCGITIADDHLTTYSTLLVHDIPNEGVVLYGHTVDPGLGGPGHLVSVQVAGNAFTQYKVHFLPPTASREDCGNPNVGVVINAGATLTGADLTTLYGASEPATPLLLVGCKLWLAATVPSIADMPITVTYRQ